MFTVAFLTIVLLAASPGRQAGPPSGQQSRGSITYLANEGVLLEGDGKKILIDGLYGDYGPAYSYPADSTQRQLMSGAGLFSGVSAVLATHRHGDHFNAATVTSHMRANPRATFVAQPQVIDSLQRHEPARTIPASRLRAVRVPVGERSSATVDGITIELLGVPHTGLSNRLLVQHLGYLTTIGGQRILHLGDAGIDEDTFKGWRLDTARVDYALVPFWMLLEREGRELVARWIKPRVTVAIHLGDPSERYAADVTRALPGARVLSKSLERISW